MDEPILIIAEVGSVHDGSLGNAGRLIDAAAACGAGAVKFQTHLASAETLPDAPPPPFFQGEPRFAYFERTAFAPEQWRSLAERCARNRVEFLSSPFSVEAVELLEELGAERYKIPSGEVSNLPLLKAVAETKKPVLLSSGMSDWTELDAAVETISRYHRNLTVLQCTTEYPCPPENVGLNVMLEMKERYGLPVGFSDHTLTLAAPLAATALGARVIEKHFTFSRLMYGSDAAHSLEPDEFRQMAAGIREIESILANPVDKSDAGRYSQMKEVFEKSLVSLAGIAPGEEFGPGNLGVKKPGTGIPAARYDEVLGKKAARAIKADTLLKPEDIIWD